MTHSWGGTSIPDVTDWFFWLLIPCKKAPNSVDVSENQWNSASHGAGPLMTGSGKDISVSKLHNMILNSYVLCFKTVLHEMNKKLK